MACIHKPYVCNTLAQIHRLPKLELDFLDGLGIPFVFLFSGSLDLCITMLLVNPSK